MFRNKGQNIADLKIDDAFNYGMAIWGASGTLDAQTFERVVELDRSRSDSQRHEISNYFQCMGIAYWAAGDQDTAVNYMERAQRAVSALRGRTVFSCWRYLQVNASLFESDLGEIRALIENGGPQIPRFVTVTTTESSKPE